MMEPTTPKASKERIGRWIKIVVIAGAALLLLVAILITDYHPRTDDANVRANFIEITAEVSGKLVALPVKDNALVKKGDLLFEIDPRPYEYALQQALSDQEALEQQIIDAKRKIASEKSAVEAANAAELNLKTGIKTAGSGVNVASASVNRAKANVAAAEAQLTYATNNLHRVQPLLEKQYVTVDQVDLANTAVQTAQGNYDQSLAALREAEAQHEQSVLRRVEADGIVVGLGRRGSGSEANRGVAGRRFGRGTHRRLARGRGTLRLSRQRVLGRNVRCGDSFRELDGRVGSLQLGRVRSLVQGNFLGQGFLFQRFLLWLVHVMDYPTRWGENQQN